MQEYRIDIRGEAQTNPDGSSRQAEIRKCEDGDAVELQREPHNPYDANAVLVLSERGRGIGYVAREEAEWLAPMMDRGMGVCAEIDAITGGYGEKKHRGVILRVLVDEDDEPDIARSPVTPPRSRSGWWLAVILLLVLAYLMA